MTGIDMNSILKKAKAYTDSPQFQKKLEAKIDSMIMNGEAADGTSGAAIILGGAGSIKDAAHKFISVLINEVEGHSGTLGSTAVSAITQLECGEPVKVGKNKYRIDINFLGDLHRESLAPSYYDGIDNIAALLNNGYQAGHSVYGIWEGHSDKAIQSLAERGGLNFIDSAVRNFMSNYASDFGVTNIEVSEVYK